MIRLWFFSSVSLVGGFVLNLFGGWDVALTALVIFMIVDFITGITVAGVFKKSPKAVGGALDSKASFMGLCRKGVTLLIVLAACQLDLLMKTQFIRNAVILSFCANELLSIIENAGLMGLPMPKVIINAVQILKDRGDKDDDKTVQP